MGSSNLQNLMTGLIWAVLALAGISPVILFYTTSTKPTPEPAPLVFKITPPTWSMHSNQPSKTPDATIQRHKMPVTKDRPEGRSLPEPVATHSDPVSEEPVSAAVFLPPSPVIQEKPERNGTPGTAQEIATCTLVGQRGSEEDHADFYKIRPTGENLILRLDPLVSESAGLHLSVLDQRQRIISDGEGKPHRLTVKPREIYYIKVDLRNVPIASAPYKLYVRSETEAQASREADRLSRNQTPGEENSDREGL